MKNLIALTIASMSLISIAHAAVEGGVTMKISSTQAQINLGETKIRQGDRVAIFQKVCQGPKVELCRKEKVGMGTVSRVLNERASEITLDNGSKVKEGYIVEKQ